MELLVGALLILSKEAVDDIQNLLFIILLFIYDPKRINLLNLNLLEAKSELNLRILGL